MRQIKLVSRASILSSCQNMALVACFSTMLAIVMILSTFAADMLIYDEGNVYSCPADHLKKEIFKLDTED